MTADKKHKLKCSPTVAAVFLFVLIVITVAPQSGLLCRSTKLEQNIEEFKNTTTNPDVVLLGSSYIFWPIGQMVSTPINDLRFSFNRNALEPVCLDNQLITYNLSNAYQIISDQCLLVNKFLVGNNKPLCVVLGCAPRDFINSDFSSPVLTESFITAVDFYEYPEYASMIQPRPEELVSSVFSKAVPLYSKRSRIKARLAEQLSCLYTSLGLHGKSSSESSHPNIWTQSKTEIWNASLKEYRQRYSYINKDKEDVQYAFLELLLQTCKRRGIRVLIVNLPVQADNLNLLPPGYYEQYCERLQRASVKSNADFLDLNKHSNFVRSDFDDTIHLNAAGGKKLFSSIFTYLQQHMLKSQSASTTPGVRTN